MNLRIDTSKTDLKNLIKHFVYFTFEFLDVDIRQISELHIYESDVLDKCYGVCHQNHEDDYIIAFKGMDNERNITDVFITLAHELVHVKQFLNNSLRFELNNRCYQNLQYSEKWWEKEAFEKQSEIVKAFVNILEQ